MWFSIFTSATLSTSSTSFEKDKVHLTNIALKGNQGSIHEAVIDFFATSEQQQYENVKHDFIEEMDK